MQKSGGEQLKKLVLLFAMSVVLVFSPLGTTTYNTIVPAKYEQVSEAHAKGYRSPSRSYRPNNNQIKRDTTKKATNNQATKNKSNNRGFLGGLLFGGIAGLLFGSMLGNMGAFGDILALIINVIAIILVIRILIYFFQKWRNRNNPKPQSNVFDHQGPTENNDGATVLDEGNISNAVIHFFTHEKGLQLDDVEVVLTYDESKGFGADVMKNGQLVQALDHFSLIQAIRYWATKEGNFDPNCGLELRFSERDGITAIVTE